MATKQTRSGDSKGEQRKNENSEESREDSVRERLGIVVHVPKPINRPNATLLSKTFAITAPSIEDKLVKLYITLSYWNNVPFEVFLATKDPASKANAEGLTRLASLWLRAGGEIDEIVEQLRGISIGATTAFNEGGARITSMCDALAYILDHNRTYHNPIPHKYHKATGEET